MSESNRSKGALAIGGLAAILASTCCLGPLVLVLLGFSGAWIGNLTILEPYRPIFIAVAVGLLFFAYRRIFRPSRPVGRESCAPSRKCERPTRSSSGSCWRWCW